MNSAVVVALFGFLAVANAGLLAAPAVVRAAPILAPAPLTTYAAGPALVKTAYASPAFVGAPLVAAGPALVRVARSAEPDPEPGHLLAAPAVGLVRTAPILAPAPLAYSTVVRAPAPSLTGSPALVRVARSAEPEPGFFAGPAIVRTAPIIAPAPLVAYSSPVLAPAVVKAPLVAGPALVRVARSPQPEPEPGHLVGAPVVPAVGLVRSPVVAAVPAVSLTRSYHGNIAPVVGVAHAAPVLL